MGADGRTLAEFLQVIDDDLCTVQEVADKLRSGADFARWDKAKTEQIIAIARELDHAPQDRRRR